MDWKNSSDEIPMEFEGCIRPHPALLSLYDRHDKYRTKLFEVLETHASGIWDLNHILTPFSWESNTGASSTARPVLEDTAQLRDKRYKMLKQELRALVFERARELNWQRHTMQEYKGALQQTKREIELRRNEYERRKTTEKELSKLPQSTIPAKLDALRTLNLEDVPTPITLPTPNEKFVVPLHPAHVSHEPAKSLFEIGTSVSVISRESRRALAKMQRAYSRRRTQKVVIPSELVESSKGIPATRRSSVVGVKKDTATAPRPPRSPSVTNILSESNIALLAAASKIVEQQERAPSAQQMVDLFVNKPSSKPKSQHVSKSRSPPYSPRVLPRQLSLSDEKKEEGFREALGRARSASHQYPKSPVEKPTVRRPLSQKLFEASVSSEKAFEKAAAKSPPRKSPSAKTPPVKSPPFKSPPVKSPPRKSLSAKTPPVKSPSAKIPSIKSPPRKLPFASPKSTNTQLSGLLSRHSPSVREDQDATAVPQGHKQVDSMIKQPLLFKEQTDHSGIALQLKQVKRPSGQLGIETKELGVSKLSSAEQRRSTSPQPTEVIHQKLNKQEKLTKQIKSRSDQRSLPKSPPRRDASTVSTRSTKLKDAVSKLPYQKSTPSEGVGVSPPKQEKRISTPPSEESPHALPSIRASSQPSTNRVVTSVPQGGDIETTPLPPAVKSIRSDAQQPTPSTTTSHVQSNLLRRSSLERKEAKESHQTKTARIEDAKPNKGSSTVKVQSPPQIREGAVAKTRMLEKIPTPPLETTKNIQFTKSLQKEIAKQDVVLSKDPAISPSTTTSVSTRDTAALPKEKEGNLAVGHKTVTPSPKASMKSQPLPEKLLKKPPPPKPSVPKSRILPVAQSALHRPTQKEHAKPKSKVLIPKQLSRSKSSSVFLKKLRMTDDQVRRSQSLRGSGEGTFATPPPQPEKDAKPAQLGTSTKILPAIRLTTASGYRKDIIPAKRLR